MTPPARIGDYALGARIGAGGMGAVYRARHVTTGVEHAVKLLPPGQDPVLAERFQREGQAQARVGRHPHVAQVHAAGSEQGWLYLVQELVEGSDLAERLRGGPLPPAEARRVAVEVGRGLAHAHAHGILHRDLKPANVLLGADGRARLVDFGLARVADARSLTETGAVLGSPHWMAPEQARSEPVDERTDVYGLGALLYHCLTGRPPVEGGSVLTLLDQVASHEPPRPRELAPEVPPALEAVCLRALAKRPDDRYATASALVEALEGADLEAGARRVGRGMAALLGAALALGLVVAPRGEPQPAPTVAPAPSSSTTLTPSPSSPTPGWPPPADVESPAAWAAVRGPDASTRACVALGRGLLAAAERDPAEAVEAARWLKRAGAKPWKAFRPEVRQRLRLAELTPRQRHHLARVLLRPPGLVYPTFQRPLTGDMDDRRWAERELREVQQEGRGEASAAAKLRAQLARMRGERSLRTRAGSSITRRDQYERALVTLEAQEPPPTLAEQHLARKHLAEVCHTVFPERALELYVWMAEHPVEADDTTYGLLSRLEIYDRLLRELRNARPDLADRERLRQAATEAVRYGASYCVPPLQAWLHGGQGDPPTEGELRRLRLNLAKGYEIQSSGVRVPLGLLYAEVFLRPPNAEPKTAFRTLYDLAMLGANPAASETFDPGEVRLWLGLWKRALPPARRADVQERIDAARTPEQRRALMRALIGEPR